MMYDTTSDWKMDRQKAESRVFQTSGTAYGKE
jgi:hypothetical protein